MSSIAKHHRENYEATDSALIDIHQLAYAIELIAGELALDRSLQSSQALFGVIDALLRRVEDLDRLRAAEWAGIGGDTSNLLSAEAVARARGETEAA